MIHGAGYSSNKCKVLSDFGKTMSALWPSKRRKCGNGNTTQEANAVVSWVVDAVINKNKNKD